MDQNPPNVPQNDHNNRRKPNLSDSQRVEALSMLLVNSKDGKILHGGYEKVSTVTGHPRAVLKRLWRRAEKTRVDGLVREEDWISRGKKNNGRPRIYNPDEVEEKLAELGRDGRRTIRATAIQLGISKTKVHEYVKEKVIRHHSSALKPYLTEENKAARIAYCLDEIENRTVSVDTWTYKNMYDRVFLDEKWFYFTFDQQGYYLAYGEEDPDRRCKHKGHVVKVMFLCAIARPRWNTASNSWWDGKIGIWPVGHFVPAARASKNRPRGSPVWKNIPVTLEVYRQLLCHQVLPAIAEKWPNITTRRHPIRLQQDGAKSHINPNDETFALAAAFLEIPCVLYTQPPNSPDLNVLDLGFFRAIQSFMSRNPTSESHLMDGDINYKIPHMTQAAQQFI
jgi:hypothetical protein